MYLYRHLTIMYVVGCLYRYNSTGTLDVLVQAPYYNVCCRVPVCCAEERCLCRTRHAWLLRPLSAQYIVTPTGWFLYVIERPVCTSLQLFTCAS